MNEDKIEQAARALKRLTEERIVHVHHGNASATARASVQMIDDPIFTRRRHLVIDFGPGVITLDENEVEAVEVGDESVRLSGPGAATVVEAVAA